MSTATEPISVALDAPLVHTAECAAQHFAPWMIEEHWFRSAVEAVRNGTLQPKAFTDEDDPEEKRKKRPYVVHDGTAIIAIAGILMKKASKFGGSSSVEIRAAIRKAVQDENVSSILLHIDSPGGTVAGTADLAADVKAADAVKPVYSHIEDLGASAAYWVGSQARRVTANSTGLVGSIGTLLVLDDTSGKYAAQGIKVHVISTGKYKGAGADGAPVTDDHLKMFQQEVDDLNEHFLNAVAKGRKMSIADVREIADGRVHIADKAKTIGLIDDVVSLDLVLSHIRKEEIKRLEASTSPQAQPTLTQPAPELPPSGEPAQAPTKEIQPMAETLTQAAPATVSAAVATSNPSQSETPQQQIGRLNDSAIQNFIEKGKIAGRAEGRQAMAEEIRAIVAACPGRPQTALNAILSGQNASTVKLIVDAEVNAEIAANKRSQEQEVAIAKLQADNSRLMELNSIGGMPGGVAMGVSTYAPGAGAANEVPTGLEPEAQAKLEWDSDPMIRARMNNKESTWLAFRTNQLKGSVRIKKSA